MIKFSVVIPCFNCRKTIAKTLESCLNQTFSCYEIIIIDDCSKEEILDVVSKYKYALNEKGIFLFYYRNIINKGVSAARNKGWNLSKGDYVCFLDADDIWHEQKLNIVRKNIEENKCKFICHDYTDDQEFKFVSQDDFLRCKLKKVFFYKILFSNPSQTSCFVLSRDIEERFDESMRYSEDYDLWLRISKIYQLYKIECIALTKLSRKQLSFGGLSGNRYKMRQGEMKAYLKFSSRYIFLPAPVLLLYSICKHVYSGIKYSFK